METENSLVAGRARRVATLRQQLADLVANLPGSESTAHVSLRQKAKGLEELLTGLHASGHGDPGVIAAITLSLKGTLEELSA